MLPEGLQGEEDKQVYTHSELMIMNYPVQDLFDVVAKNACSSPAARGESAQVGKQRGTQIELVRSLAERRKCSVYEAELDRS